MMKNKSLLLTLAATAMMATFAACSNDLNEAVKNSSNIRFTSKVINGVGTRAATDIQTSQLVNGLQVGLFSSEVSGADNVALTADGSGGLSYSGSLNWPSTGSASFYAYAPYAAENTGKISSDISFTVNANQATETNYLASDLLYAATTGASNGSEVVLGFSHKLVKVIVKLSTTSEKVSLSSPTVNLLGVVKDVTLNVQSGTVTSGSNTGTVKVHEFSSDANTYECAAVIAPQTIKAETSFVQIVNDGKSYNCALYSDKELTAGGSYIFNVSFDGKAASISATSTLTAWTPNGETNVYGEEVVSFGVGDYLLADGSFVKKAEIGGESPIGVIFSTDVSSTDAAAGYNAYILGLYDLSKSTAKVSTQSVASLPGMTFTSNSKLSDYVADLDGLSHTTAILAESNGATDYPLFDLSSLNLASFTGKTNISSWFIPSAGQMFQILTNLGGVKVTSNTSSARGFCVCPTTQESVSKNFMPYEVASSPALATLISTLKAATNNVEVFKSGSNYACASYYLQQSSSTSANAYMFGLSNSFTGSDMSSTYGDCWGTCNGNITNARARVVCIAAKIN